MESLTDDEKFKLIEAMNIIITNNNPYDPFATYIKRYRNDLIESLLKSQKMENYRTIRIANDPQTYHAIHKIGDDDKIISTKFAKNENNGRIN